MRISVAVLVLSLLAIGCSKPPLPKAPEPRFVHYDIGKDDPKEDADQQKIGVAAGVLSADAKLNAIVIGYASADGDATKNKDLSRRRAGKVRDALVAQGVDASRLQTAWKGADDAVATNDTEDGRKKNRRVEVFFFYPQNGDAKTQYGGKIEIFVQ